MRHRLLAVLLKDKTAIKFIVGVTLGFAFSMSVILSTIGIMDGFERTLRLGLKKSMGDITIHSRHGFFDVKKRISHELELLELNTFAGIVQTEGFIIFNEKAKGILVKGVNNNEFNKVTGLEININDRNVAIGTELSKYLELKVGDEIVLSFANGNKDISALPSLSRFKVGQIVEHGIYQKNMRMVYLNRETLQTILNIDNRINIVAVNTVDVEQTLDALSSNLGYEYAVRPYWSDFSTLLQAVKTEKFFISIILQLIVIISIINVLAFIVFLNEKRSREIFLFRAVGMGQKEIKYAWLALMSLIWLLSCFISLIFVEFFNYGLQNFSILQLPPSVYSFGKLSLLLGTIEYVIVFVLSYLWLIAVSWFGLVRLSKQSILVGLRKEFS